MTDTTIKEKIVTKLNKHSNVIDEAGNCVIDDFSYQDLANDIQKLLIQEKIDLLNECNVICGSSYIRDKVSELEAQLKELNK